MNTSRSALVMVMAASLGAVNACSKPATSTAAAAPLPTTVVALPEAIIPTAPSVGEAPSLATPPLPRPAFATDVDFATQFDGWKEYMLAQPQPAYPLNEWSRTVPAKGRLPCPDVPMVNYRGSKLNYGKTMKLYQELVPHIEKMEDIIIQVAKDVYGRAPSRLQTLGTLNCRRMRTYPTYISEHAFANAIDLAGFEFAAATKSQRATLPKALWGAQVVTVLGDWKGGRGNKATHQVFLHKLILELIKNDVFTLYLGPGFPGHEDHFHLDMSNFRMIDLSSD